jgi:hypothetical protein
MEPDDWSFTEKLMPKKGSLWLLFIGENGSPHTTYRGDFGRTPAQAHTGIEVCQNIPEVTQSIAIEPISTDTKAKNASDPTLGSLFDCNNDSDCIAVGNSCGLKSLFKNQTPSKQAFRCVCEKSDLGSACRKQ